MVVETAIRETCRIRKWELLALNVRTNHVHAVVSTKQIPERVLNALKANATRRLREKELWTHPFSPSQIKAAIASCGTNGVLRGQLIMYSTDRATNCQTLTTSLDPSQYHLR